MNLNFLDFEQPIAELEARIDQLRHTVADSGLDLNEEIHQLSEKSRQLTQQIFGKLTDWQMVQLSRHPQRPYTLDYVRHICEEFHELHGDRAFADDEAIVGGLARIDGMPVMVIGHEKGRDTNEKIRRNFGMPRPEGYRKALRLMKMAERFGLPILTFIDTPGAYPGINAEERGQSEAIARNLIEMAELSVPMDEIVNEPLGGAHRSHEQAAANLKQKLVAHLRALEKIPSNELLKRRYDRYMKYGNFTTA
ncbi:MAG: hypothetical protein B7Z48_05870 [Thiotrichales bacterium 12-47-6]|nr:MAG: hypothetical protein B7Z48_05870 [Thiotrichales bacterium 12-47-6]